MSPCTFSPSFPLSYTYAWRKQKTQSEGRTDHSVQSIIWETHDQSSSGCSSISSMSCAPGSPLHAQNIMSQQRPLTAWLRIMLWIWTVGPELTKRRCFRPVPKWTQIFEDHFLLPLVLTSPWRKSSLLKPVEINAVAAQINLTSTRYFFKLCLLGRFYSLF